MIIGTTLHRIAQAQQQNYDNAYILYDSLSTRLNQTAFSLKMASRTRLTRVRLAWTWLAVFFLKTPFGIFKYPGKANKFLMYLL